MVEWSIEVDWTGEKEVERLGKEIGKGVERGSFEEDGFGNS